MGIADRLRRAFGSEPEQTYRYQCQVCHVTFSSTEPSAGAVACESCGASDVRALD